MSFRLLVIMVLLIAIALWREAIAPVEHSSFSELSQMNQTATTDKNLLTHRLAPPPDWSTVSSPLLSSNSSTTLMQSVGLTPPDSSSTRASAR